MVDNDSRYNVKNDDDWDAGLDDYKLGDDSGSKSDLCSNDKVLQECG